jgi:hypothetical protein
MPMKLNQIVAKTDRMRKLNATLVKVVGYKAGRNRAGLAVAVAKTYTPKEYNSHLKVVKSRDQNKYVSSVTFIDSKLNVKVSCSCPDFMFRHEFSLHHYGAADIIYGNGEPPVITNPGMRPSCCKHILALRALIKAKHNV